MVETGGVSPHPGGLNTCLTTHPQARPHDATTLHPAIMREAPRGRPAYRPSTPHPPSTASITLATSRCLASVAQPVERRPVRTDAGEDTHAASTVRPCHEAELGLGPGWQVRQRDARQLVRDAAAALQSRPAATTCDEPGAIGLFQEIVEPGVGAIRHRLVATGHGQRRRVHRLVVVGPRRFQRVERD